MNEFEMTLAVYEQLMPRCEFDKDGHSLVFYTPTEHVKAVVENMFIAEPETIAWINEFKTGEVFLDIGANIGLYTVWAALTKKVTVHAFEPESLSNSILNRNITDNGLADLVTCYAAAVSDKPGFGLLHLSVLEPGESCHVFGDKVDYTGSAFTPAYSQGCYSTTIDELVASGTVPPPHHIKIDVDGIEAKVISGSATTLESKTLRSVLVEINDDREEDAGLIKLMAKLGFDAEQAPPSVLAPISSVHNVIFRR